MKKKYFFKENLMSKLFWSFFIFFSLSVYGIEETKIRLNKSEKEWIKRNKNKNIGIYLSKDIGLLNYYSNGQKKGLFPYLIKSLEENTGLNFRVIDQKTKIFRRSVDYGIPDIVIGVEDYKRNN